MSLLSSTQGTPERVWSLVSVIAGNGGTLSKADAAAWLNPGFTRNGESVQVKPTAFSQVLGAATSLGAVEADAATLRLTPACCVTSYATFCDWVHDTLIALDSADKDAVVLETFAWLAVEADRQGAAGWINEWTNDAFADAADQALPEGADDDGDRRINKDKLPSWRRWLMCLGLMVSLPLPSQLYPLADGRLIRELARVGTHRDQEVSADAFLAGLAVRLPYLDGGRMFLEATRRLGHSPAPRRLSPILSAALRNRSEERRVGKECVSTVRSRWSPYP